MLRSRPATVRSSTVALESTKPRSWDGIDCEKRRNDSNRLAHALSTYIGDEEQSSGLLYLLQGPQFQGREPRRVLVDSCRIEINGPGAIEYPAAIFHMFSRMYRRLYR